MKKILYGIIIMAGISCTGIVFAQPASCGLKYQLDESSESGKLCDNGIAKNGTCGERGGYCAELLSGGTSDSLSTGYVCIKYSDIEAYHRECPPPAGLAGKKNNNQKKSFSPCDDTVIPQKIKDRTNYFDIYADKKSPKPSFFSANVFELFLNFITHKNQ
jgi:hypothetical protein